MISREDEDKLITWGYSRRPYGWKLTINETSQNIIIEPEKHTGMGADPKSLNEHGLRGHPGAAWEQVKHLGYFRGSESKDTSLLYRYLDPEGKIQEKLYRKGDIFFSVLGERGYWHILVNNSEEFPIKLFIAWQNT